MNKNPLESGTAILSGCVHNVWDKRCARYVH